MYFKNRRLVGKSLSALCSSSLQNLSSSGRSHSLTEAVYFAFLSLFRLIGSFHNLFSCFWFLTFFLILIIYCGLSHDNSHIIPQRRKRRQAILNAFSFFCFEFREIFLIFRHFFSRRYREILPYVALRCHSETA